jgi:hypothetical protein
LSVDGAHISEPISSHQSENVSWFSLDRQWWELIGLPMCLPSSDKTSFVGDLNWCLWSRVFQVDERRCWFPRSVVKLLPLIYWKGAIPNLISATSRQGSGIKQSIVAHN